MNLAEYGKAFVGWAIVLPGVIRNCQWFGEVEKTFPSASLALRLTLDDGPDPHQTPQILDTLARAGISATFFVIGRKVESHPALCRRMVAEGHSVQNHTFSHPVGSFWASTYNRAAMEIARCSQAIEEATGHSPTQFRAPVGMANPFVHLAARDLGLKLVGWSASGHDGLQHKPARVVARIRRAVRPGAIVLLHENSLAGMRRGERACTLSSLLNTLRNDSYHFPAEPPLPSV